MKGIDPRKVPKEVLHEMASTIAADAWVDMQQALGKEYSHLNTLIFARLLNALVDTARAQGVEDSHILGEFWGVFPDEVNFRD